MEKVVLIFIMIFFVKPSEIFSQEIANEIKEVSLFNGKDLDGWKIYGTEKWYVEKGQLVCENGEDEGFGYLITNKHYKNFELTLEYKQETKGNSGVFVRSTIKDTKVKGWQVEIGPPGHNTGGVHEYERGWLSKPDVEKDKAIKVGKWNYMKIRVQGEELISWLNGTQMVKLIDKKLGEGKGGIALQIHNGNYTKIHWRNIQITEL